jgi:nucleoside-diphosphate-sugar epimerase
MYKLPRPRVLVTGANGFIGKHALPLLIQKGYEVHAISTRKHPFHPQVAWHQTNLLDPLQTDQLLQQINPSSLLHLAWITTPKIYWSSLENLTWMQASLDLLVSFAKYGGKRAAIAGTCAEYEWNSEEYSEHTTPLIPTTLYGTCKRSLYLILKSLCAQMNISLAWGYVFFILGPHEPSERLFPSVIQNLLRKEEATCFHSHQIRDFLYVSDAAEALVSLLDSPLEGTFNIGSGQGCSLKEAMSLICEQIGCRDLVQFESLTTKEPPVLIANIEKIKKDL